MEPTSLSDDKVRRVKELRQQNSSFRNLNRLLNEANLKKLKLHSSSPHLSKFLVMMAICILPLGSFPFTFTVGTNMAISYAALASEVRLQRLGGDKQSKKPTKKKQRTTSSEWLRWLRLRPPSRQRPCLYHHHHCQCCSLAYRQARCRRVITRLMLACLIRPT